MDLSKLPKLSQTPPASHAEPGTEPAGAPVRPAEGGLPAEGLIDLVIGALVIWMSWPLADYLIHLLTGREFGYPVTDTASGNVLPYPTTAFFWMHLGTMLFGLGLMAHAFLGRRGSRQAVLGLLAVFLVSAAVNVFALIYELRAIGVQVTTVLAGAFSVYMAMVLKNRLAGRSG